MARQHDGGVTVIQFDEVPDQAPLEYASETQLPADLQFDAVVNFAQHDDADAILMERYPGGLRHRFFGSSVEWILRRAPCDVVLVEDREFDSVAEITVLTDQGPYDPSKVRVADALASELGATVRLVYAVESPATNEFKETIRATTPNWSVSVLRRSRLRSSNRTARCVSYCLSHNRPSSSS